MIVLTSAQEAIVKDDEAVKNFVVHFPNGERADLTNDDIVFESVKFSESVCSDQSFRFGSADASCIEFETVGVGNIIGLVIECGMTFTLGADSVTIPYGTFIVDSCPRDHASMVHRKVTAYTPSLNNGYLSIYERWKLSKPLYSEQTYEPNLLCLIEENFGLLDIFEHSESVGTSYSAGQQITTIGLRTTAKDGVTYHYDLELKLFISRPMVFSSRTWLPDTVYKLEGFTEHPSALQPLYDMLTNNTDVNGNDFEEYIDSAIKPRKYDALQFCERYTNASETPMMAYPFLNANSSAKYVCNYVEIAEAKLLETDGHQNVRTVDSIADVLKPITDVTVKGYQITSETIPMILSFSQTLKTVNGNATIYSFINTYSLSDLVGGFAELNAGFLRRNRDETFTLLHLDNSAPYALTASDVEGSAWWDEYVIQPVGTVTYSFTDDEEEQTAEYVIDESNTSVYDMSGNYLLKKMVIDVEAVTTSSAMTDTRKYYTMGGNWYYYDGSAWVNAGTYKDKTSIVEKIIATYFVPYLGAIDFTPLEATFRGMPYLQCGDAITLTAADGTVINSYILNQSFDGIQHSSQDVETVQGTVIGSEIVY